YLVIIDNRYRITHVAVTRWSVLLHYSPVDQLTIDELLFDYTDCESGSNCYRDVSGFASCAALTLLRYRSRWRFQSGNGFGRHRFDAAVKSSNTACARRITGLRNLFADYPQTRRSQRTAIRCYLH